MRLRPLLFRFAFILLFGFFTTVAVAWCFAAFGEWNTPHAGSAFLASRGSSVSDIAVQQASQRGMLVRDVFVITIDSPPFTSTYGRSILPYTSRAHDLLVAGDVDTSWGLARRTLVNGDKLCSGVERAFGWPMLAAYWQHDPDGTPTGGAQLRLPSDDPWGKGDRFLPTIPIWRGMVLNVAFYGVAWWFLFAVNGLVRRVRRRRRGGCPECGYAVADLRRCPECGWARHERTPEVSTKS